MNGGTLLYITMVDTAAWADRPNSQAIIWASPVVNAFDSDPPGSIIPVVFEIDPPVRLEHGQYAFFLAPACDRGAVGYILCDTRNGYPDGIYWITHRGGDCVPSPVAGGGDNDDLCFRAEFCGAETTPVMRKSWGAVKAIYR